MPLVISTPSALNMAWALAALFAVSSASAQSARPAAPASIIAACPLAVEVTHLHLQGRWLAEVGVAQSGKPAPAPVALQLGAHPELSESVRGTVQRGAENALVSGDVDQGAFTLEESLNGINISATWVGQVVDESCGREIRGTWNKAKSLSPSSDSPFILRKQASWQ